MEKHYMGIIPIGASRMLERIGHYGMRSMLMIYITRGALHMPAIEAATLYGWFTGMIGLLPVFGGLLGDLVLGPRRASIAGGFIQAAGCFALCLPGVYSLYAGLVLIAAGLGMFQPNIVATLGLLYKGRPKLMDSAMMILYISLIAGAFAGSFLMVLGDLINYEAVFISAGLCIITSQLILIFSVKSLEQPVPESYSHIQPEAVNLENSGVLLTAFIFLFILMPLLWVVENSLSTQTLDFIMGSAGRAFPNSERLMSVYNIVNPATIIPGGILLAIVWSFVNVSSFLKIGLGFLIYALGCACCYLMVAGHGSPVLVFLAVGLVLESIAELLISPTALALICRYAPPRRIATLTGAYLAINTVISHAFAFLFSFQTRIPQSILFGAMMAIIIFVDALYIVFYVLVKRDSLKTPLVEVK